MVSAKVAAAPDEVEATWSEDEEAEEEAAVEHGDTKDWETFQDAEEEGEGEGAAGGAARDSPAHSLALRLAAGAAPWAGARSSDPSPREEREASGRALPTVRRVTVGHV